MQRAFGNSFPNCSFSNLGQRGSVVSVNSDSVDPTWFIGDLVTCLLKTPVSSCLLLTLRHTARHYATLLAKLGCPVTKLLAENRLKIVDMAADLIVPGCDLVESSSGVDVSNAISHHRLLDIEGLCNGDSILKTTILQYFSSIFEAQQQSNCLLVIDDLSVLLDLGLETGSLVEIIHILIGKFRVNYNGGDCAGRIVSCIIGFNSGCNFVGQRCGSHYSDGARFSGGSDGEHRTAIENVGKLLLHSADVRFIIRPFSTGCSKEAFCEITEYNFLSGDDCLLSNSRNVDAKLARRFHCRLGDRSVAYLPPGASALIAS